MIDYRSWTYSGKWFKGCWKLTKKILLLLFRLSPFGLKGNSETMASFFKILFYNIKIPWPPEDHYASVLPIILAHTPISNVQCCFVKRINIPLYAVILAGVHQSFKSRCKFLEANYHKPLWKIGHILSKKLTEKRRKCLMQNNLLCVWDMGEQTQMESYRCSASEWQTLFNWMHSPHLDRCCLSASPSLLLQSCMSFNESASWPLVRLWGVCVWTREMSTSEREVQLNVFFL